MGRRGEEEDDSHGVHFNFFAASVYHHKEKDIMVVVHVDDFLASGQQDQLDRLKKDMMETFDLSGIRIGPESNDEHEVKYLNRILRWTPENMMSYEADPKHVQLLLKEWGLAEAKGAVAPTTKSLVDGIGKGEVLDDLASTRTRRSIARLNYLSQDRPDIAYISKELSKHMANPFTGTLKALHVVIKYLKAYTRMVQEWQAEFNKEDYGSAGILRQPLGQRRHHAEIDVRRGFDPWTGCDCTLVQIAGDCRVVFWGGRVQWDD